MLWNPFLSRMEMQISRWMLPLVAVAAFGQDSGPFPPEATSPWSPAWELTFRSDQVASPSAGPENFRRAGLQLRLRWSWEWEALHLEAGTRSATGSDGNRFNPPRWDQEPSNGTQVDVAWGSLAWVEDRRFASLSLGLQGNGLIASQAVWDRDLRVLGAGGLAGIRGADGRLQEASVRGIAGRVRTILGGDVDLAAGQVVLKVDTGAWSWTAHAARWSLTWDPGGERLRRLPNHNGADRQRMVLDAVGASGTWNTRLPVEARWSWSRNRETRETSVEAQAALGSHERVLWPRAAVTWQRLSSTGTLYPVNGDEWWFYRRARGPRFDLALPLPGRWILTFVYVRQRADDEDYAVTRKILSLAHRF